MGYGRFAVWAGLIAGAFGVGGILRAAGALPVDALPPLHAHIRLLVVPLLPAVALASAGVVVLPLAARRLRWPVLLGVAWLASAAWAVALQAPDGLSRPLTNRADYLAGLPAMGNRPLAWLRGFASHLSEYPIHVEGHPPLPMLILWILRWTGLGGPNWAAAFVIAAGTSATVAIAVTVRKVAQEDLARRAVPFLVLSPAVICLATSMDALFLGVAAWATALLANAAASRRETIPRPPRGTVPYPSSRAVDGGDKGFHRLWITRWFPHKAAEAVAALIAGLLAGSLPYLSYGLVTILAIPLVVLLLGRSPRTITITFAVGALIVPLGFTAGGFRWWDGVAATHSAWAAGAGAHRPYAYFLVGDLAVLALIIGPVAAQTLPYLLRLVRRAATPTAAEARLGAIVAAALAGVLALDLSGVTRGEVERIWLPYAAWMTAGAAVHRRPARRMLITQAVTALLIQALVRSPW